jgi:hypothetical protein
MCKQDKELSIINNNMTDFYNNLPETKEDIDIYLRSWLQPIENGTKHIYKGNTWTQKYGFCRAFQIHGVYVNDVTNEYSFHVNEYEWQEKTEPNFGVYNDFDSMISGVSDLYFKLWKLDM